MHDKPALRWAVYELGAVMAHTYGDVRAGVPEAQHWAIASLAVNIGKTKTDFLWGYCP